MPAFCRRFAAMLLVTSVAGCAESGIDLGDFATVSGRVTHAGAPLKEGLVTFNCPASGQVATAKIQPDGTYVMKLGERDGLPLGEYKVSIRPPLTRSQEHFRRANVPKPNGDDGGFEIPQKFRFETSSGLVRMVESGSNSFDFDLGE